MQISSKEAFDHLVQLVRLDVKRRGLHAFVQHFWEASGEGAAYCDNWHLGMLDLVLEEHAYFRMRDTVINVPPSTGKTLRVQVFWPAWVWACVDPARRFFCTSYDHGKIHETARQFLRLTRSPLYQACYGDVVKFNRTNQSEEQIELLSGGRRLAYQMGSGITGKHAHHVVCDDPDKAGETSPEAFDKTEQHWNKDFSSRKADPQHHSNIIIMQRLNHDDLAGRMLRKPHSYEHVCFPMRYVPNCPWDCGCSLGKLDVRTEPGQLLWPERYTADIVQRSEIAFGSAQVASAQYQQNPVPDKGNFFEDAWFRTWEKLPHPGAMHIVQSWDLGFKGRAGKGSADSWVHGCLWAKHEKRYLLLDEVRGHWNYPETKRQFIAAQSRPLWGAASCILLEDKANGPALIAECRETLDFATPIKAVEPHGSKEDRAKRHSAKAEAGLIWLPPVEQMPSVAEWRAEIVRFPHQKINDRVDTMTQALDELDEGMGRSLELWKEIIANM